MSAGSFGSTTKRTGMRRDSPALSTCSVKQKHSVLLKYSEAVFGATLGTALPTIACGASLVASNQASLSAPGCTRIEIFSGVNCHFSALLTWATNCTVTQRDSSAVNAATLAGLSGVLRRRPPR